MKRTSTPGTGTTDLCDTVSHSRNTKSTQSRPAKEDVRSVRTDKALREALLNLLRRESFDAITIRKICAEAGVHYATFFRRYDSKESFLDHVARNQIEQLLQLALPVSYEAGDLAGFEALCSYVDDHQGLWRILLNGGAGSTLRGEFQRLSLDVALAQEVEHPTLPVELATSCSVAVIIETLSWWLRQPDGQYPANTVAKMLHQQLSGAGLLRSQD